MGSNYINYLIEYLAFVVAEMWRDNVSWQCFKSAHKKKTQTQIQTLYRAGFIPIVTRFSKHVHNMC